MSPNVKAAMRAWGEGKRPFAAFDGIPEWALERAAEITEQTVPQVHPTDTRNMLYAMPAGLKVRLTAEIARALVEAREGDEK